MPHVNTLRVPDDFVLYRKITVAVGVSLEPELVATGFGLCLLALEMEADQLLYNGTCGHLAVSLLYGVVCRLSDGFIGTQLCAAGHVCYCRS